MTNTYQHLGIFSDLVQAANDQQPIFPIASPGSETQQRLREVLGFCNKPEIPQEVQIERRWQRDGISGEEISWAVGYGPRAHAWVLKPTDAPPQLPGIVALFDHGGFKFYGKEKITDDDHDPSPVLREYRNRLYGGRAYANELAKAGFVVLIPDVFLWGSRKFPFETMPPPVQEISHTLIKATPPEAATPLEIAQYNIAAYHHEHWVSKYCNVLGTTLAGVVGYEDRLAVNYLLSRPDVIQQQVGCIGLSGGGGRAVLLNATHARVGAAVVVGLMSTYEGLLDHNMSHTWLIFPFGWARYGDWSDIAACRAPTPLLVQYDLDDPLFTVQGMRDADARIKKHYASVGHPAAYVGEFYPGPHKFDLEMQAAAFAWFGKVLK